jgi:hypothetical protein
MTPLVVRTMSAFAIDPPVHLRAHPEQAIRSLDEAADVVRGYAREHFDPATESVLHRLEGAVTLYEAKDAANAFRAWAEHEGMLLIPPEDR